MDIELSIPYKTKKVYRCKDLNEMQQRFVHAIAAGLTIQQAAKQAGYKKVSHAKHILETKRIKDALLRLKIKYRQIEVIDQRTTKEAILNELVTIVDATKAKEDYKTSITAISEINRISGHYAPTQTQNINLNAETTLEDIRNAQAAYKKDM